MWKLFTALTVLTLIVTVWLTYELGIWESKRVEAADKVEGQIQQLEDGLTARNKELNDQEAALKKRERSLEEKEKILNMSVVNYERVIRELRARVSELEQLSDKRLDSVRNVYEKMDPKKASKILNDMDIQLTAGILGGMKGEKAADILSHMSQEKARLVTERYMGKKGLSRVNEVRSNASDGQQELVPLKGGEQ